MIEDDVVVEGDESVVLTGYYQINFTRNGSASVSVDILDVDGT